MADSHDMKPNNRTYEGFLSLLKWALPLIAIIVLVVIFLIS